MSRMGRGRSIAQAWSLGFLMGSLLLAFLLNSKSMEATGVPSFFSNVSADNLCLTPMPPVSTPTALFGSSDCSLDETVPLPIYEPSFLIRIPVVIHIIQDTPCVDGNVSDATARSQIDILNEDFRALAGSPGAAGTDTRIEFFLATRDPNGAPTTGITRDCNTTWFQDGGNYWETLAWDPHRYLNLYSNTAAGARGYVPELPATGEGAIVGLDSDRVVVNWLTFGRDSPFPPHDQGRTATHEVGHYLGLFHPYFGGCGAASAPACYTTGDRLCDTPPDESSHDLCPVGATSCGGTPVPIENYMELTDDLCMTGFTFEQAGRMRCTLATYRTGFNTGIFTDGFESGDTGAWSAVIPGFHP